MDDGFDRIFLWSGQRYVLKFHRVLEDHELVWFIILNSSPNILEYGHELLWFIILNSSPNSLEN